MDILRMLNRALHDQDLRTGTIRMSPSTFVSVTRAMAADANPFLAQSHPPRWGMFTLVEDDAVPDGEFVFDGTQHGVV